MTTYGLTDTGFVPKTMEAIVEDMRAAFRTRFSPSIPLGDGEYLGQSVQILGEAISLVWDALQAVNAAMDPDAATGAQLEALCALTGTFRDAARNSTVPLYLTGTPGTPVPAESRARVGSVMKYVGPGDEFETDADATIGAAVAWVTLTAYTIGEIRTSANRIYIATASGTSGATPPSSTFTGIVDGTVTWDYLGDGTGYVATTATAAEPGAVEGAARAVNEIRTPIAGWSDVINVEAAVVGASAQTDAGLRLSRAAELAGAGTSPIDAIRANVLQVTGVTSCRVFYNNTETTDVAGVPPHAVEVLVQGGSNQEIADALLANVAIGIGYHGTDSVAAVDSYGTTHTIKFSRPAEIKVYVAVTVLKDDDTFPADGAAQIKAAIAAYALSVAVGRNAVASVIGAQAFQVTGVLDVTATLISTTVGPTLPTTIVITDRQILTIATGDVGVTATNGDV